MVSTTSPSIIRIRGSSSGAPARWPRISRFQRITAPTSSITSTCASLGSTSRAARAVNPMPSPPIKTRAPRLVASPAQPCTASFSSEAWLLLFISSWPSTRIAYWSSRSDRTRSLPSLVSARSSVFHGSTTRLLPRKRRLRKAKDGSFALRGRRSPIRPSGHELIRRGARHGRSETPHGGGPGHRAGRRQDRAGGFGRKEAAGGPGGAGGPGPGGDPLLSERAALRRDRRRADRRQHHQPRPPGHRHGDGHPRRREPGGAGRRRAGGDRSDRPVGRGGAGQGGGGASRGAAAGRGSQRLHHRDLEHRRGGGRIVGAGVGLGGPVGVAQRRRSADGAAGAGRGERPACADRTQARRGSVERAGDPARGSGPSDHGGGDGGGGGAGHPAGAGVGATEGRAAAGAAGGDQEPPDGGAQERPARGGDPARLGALSPGKPGSGQGAARAGGAEPGLRQGPGAHRGRGGEEGGQRRR